MENIRTIAYGASLTALGIAMSDPEHTLILEPTGLAGSEFIDALRFDGPVSTRPSSPLSRALQEEVNKRNIADEQNRLHMPSLTSPLLLLTDRFGLKILFCAALISAQRKEGSMEVTAVCQNAIHTWRAERFVNTTSDIMRLRAADALRGVTLNALLQGDYVPYEKAGARTVQGRFHGSFVLEIAVDPQQTYADHRARIINFMQNLPAGLSGVRLMHVANTLCVRAKEAPWEDGYAPSCAQPDIYAAIDQGAKLGGAWL